MSFSSIIFRRLCGQMRRGLSAAINKAARPVSSITGPEPLFVERGGGAGSSVFPAIIRPVGTSYSH